MHWTRPRGGEDRWPRTGGARVRRLHVARVRQGELGSLPAIVGLLAIWTYFEIKEPTYLSARNLSNLVLQIAVTGTLAIGIVLVLLLSEIDLSVGAVSILCSAVLRTPIVNHGWSWYWALLLMLVVGAAIGVFQGFWFAVIGVPSFVVTLAGLLLWQGVEQYVLGSTGTINVYEPSDRCDRSVLDPARLLGVDPRDRRRGDLRAHALPDHARAPAPGRASRRAARRRRRPDRPRRGARAVRRGCPHGNLNSFWVFGKGVYTNPASRSSA